MTQAHEYALLAAGAYSDIRRRSENLAPIPPGWSELTQYAVSGSGSNATIEGSGFSAKVYKNEATGEIVISYAGTEAKISLGAALDFTSANFPLAAGDQSQQALEAALLYQRIKTAEGSNITFTGHSLGGGLASVIAVWFDRPAKVFAPTPSERAALRSTVEPSTKRCLV